MQPKHSPIPLYYVHCSVDDTVLVGMDLTTDGETVSWFDTVKRRNMLAAKVVDATPLSFTFERDAQEGGGVYVFVPMTLEVYRATVRAKLSTHAPDFESEEVMHAAFEQTVEDAW